MSNFEKYTTALQIYYSAHVFAEKKSFSCPKTDKVPPVSKKIYAR